MTPVNMAETKMQLVDWLDDLCVRFIINLPQEELISVERICFQVEEAQWFYEDFIRPLDSTLPSMPLKTFCLLIFKHCPLLASFSEYHHLTAFEEFLAYKTRVPVRGAIILNQAMDEVLLVKGWKKGANWSFPRGKINKDERDLDCAVREVYEETGYDIKAAGLIPDYSKAKYIEVTMREQHMKLYVFRGVPQDTFFQPRTRKEISKIEWYKLAHLPGYHKSKQNQNNDHDESLKANRFYMVAPFLPQLKKWIGQQRRNQAPHARESSGQGAFPVSDAADNYDTEENELQRNLQLAQTVQNDYARQTHARMNQPVNPAMLQPAAMPQLSETAAATELKRLLSVDQPVVQETAPVPGSAAALLSMLRQSGTSAVDLLSMLRQSETRPAPVATHTQVPQQTFENMHFDQRQPVIAQQYQAPPQRLPEMSADTPLQHRVNLTQFQSNEPFQQQLPRSTMSRFDHPHSNLAPMQQRYPPGPVSSQQNLTSLQHSMDKQNLSPPQQALPPYQRTGDPHFARETQMPSHQGPIIPAASDLPPPKLSNHALTLLNAFRGDSAVSGIKTDAVQPSSAVNITGEQPRVLPLHQGEQDQENLPIPKQIGHRQTESRSRQALSQALSGSNVPENRSNTLASAPPTNISPAPQMMQQKTLLDLFRKPVQSPAVPQQESSATGQTMSDLLQGPKSPQELSSQVDSKRPEIVNQQRSFLVPEPVEFSAELSALPSPGISQQKRQLFDPKDGTMKEHAPQPRVLARPSSSHNANRDPSTSPLVSATMSRPPNVPDFGTMRRKPRHGESSTDMAEVVSKEQEQPTQAPIQILRRPASPMKPSAAIEMKIGSKPSQKPENRRPVTPSTLHTGQTPTSPAELKGSTPKPFQPQILRRPQPSPPVQSSPQFRKASPPPPPKSETHQKSRNTFSSPAPTNDANLQATATAIRPSSRTRPRQPPPTQPSLDRRSSNTAEQKQALLSLFGKSKAPSSTASPVHGQQHQSTSQTQSPGSASPVMSPLAQSPPPMQGYMPVSAPTSMSSVKPVSARLSPFSSFSHGGRIPPDGAAPHAPTPPPTVQATPPPLPTAIATGTGVGDTAQEEVRRGSQGLISPVDRGFLLSYLGGFANGPKR